MSVPYPYVLVFFCESLNVKVLDCCDVICLSHHLDLVPLESLIQLIDVQHNCGTTCRQISRLETVSKDYEDFQTQITKWKCSLEINSYIVNNLSRFSLSK